MKRILLIISCVVLFALQCNAQNGKNVYGLKVGPTLNWASPASSEAEGNGARLGFGVGVVYDRCLTDHLAVSSGLGYYLLGQSYRFTDNRIVPGFLESANVGEVDRKSRGSYLEVPLKIKVRHEVAESLKAFVEGGAALSLNLSDKAKDEFDFFGWSYSDAAYVAVTGEYRLLQAALKFGAGVEYEINSRISLFAQLTYHLALSNMFTKDLYKLTGSDLRTNFIGIEVGIMH